MSRFSTPAERSIFASRIAYDALAVDSGEESEEEIVQEEPETSSTTEEPVKLTKSAIKKAQRVARLERKQQQKEKAKSQSLALKGATALQSLMTGVESPISPVQKSAPVSSNLEKPQHVISSAKDLVNDVDVQSPLNAQLLTVPSPVPEVKPTLSNGGLHKNENTETNGNGNVHAPYQDHSPTVSSNLATKVTEVRAPLQPEEKVTASPLPPPAPALPSKSEHSLHVVATLPQVSADSSGLPPAKRDAEQVKKRQNVLTRILWTFIMIFGFIGLLLLGHAYMILLVMLCQTLVYREVTALFSLKSTSNEVNSNKPDLKGKDPWSKTLNWYFFAVTNYFLYGESIIYYFKHVVFADAQLLPFATNHRMISFTLYTLGFMGFVMSLKKGYLKQQFGLFCWVHMSLLIIVFSSHFIVNNILEGLIWFWVPASLVICNDCFAYIWGVTLGRTPLIKLSPKKTVEGFVGAFWSTLIFAVIWGTYFMQFNYMICPVHDLGVSAWSSMACSPNPIFVWRNIELWRPVSALLSTLLGRSVSTIPYAPYQLHLLLLACFASLVAPFGGFFASGFKRAFNIKDFGQSIPGHGGMTDRMDCQFLMGVFTYVYYSSLIRENNVNVGGILQMIVSGLSIDQQLELIADLTRYLEKQGITVP